MYAICIRHTCLRSYCSSGHFSFVGLWPEVDLPIGVFVGPRVTTDASHMLRKILQVTLVILHVLSRAQCSSTLGTPVDLLQHFLIRQLGASLELGCVDGIRGSRLRRLALFLTVAPEPEALAPSWGSAPALGGQFELPAGRMWENPPWSPSGAGAQTQLE